jgi:hypothetical protein
MSIISKLACSLGRRDEVPNQELAQQIFKSKNKKAVLELVENLSNKDKNIQSDCIKVLYEIGEHQAELIAGYDKEFLALLENKNNRLAWGAMTALDCIASVNPKGIYKSLPKIATAADQGSVITKDHFVGILIKLAANKTYADVALTLLLDQLRTCATNQLGMYAERASSVIRGSYTGEFSRVLTTRLDRIEKESQRRRIEKVIRKLAKSSVKTV